MSLIRAIFSFVSLALLRVNVEALRIDGIYKSDESEHMQGFYLTSFAFSGDTALIKYSINVTRSDFRLYMFLDEDLDDMISKPDCYDKYEMARSTHMFNSTAGNFTVVAFNSPRIWHLYLADEATCSMAQEDRFSVAYEFVLLNSDTWNHPTLHASSEESGLRSFFYLLTITYFVLICILGPKVYESLLKGGSMVVVVQILTTALCTQALSCSFNMLHYRSYSLTGFHFSISWVFVTFFDLASQICMLATVLCMTEGWTSSGGGVTSLPSISERLSTLFAKPSTRLLCVLQLIYCSSVVLLYYDLNSSSLYRIFHSRVGLTVTFGRLATSAVVTVILQNQASQERSLLKKDFFNKFSKHCLLWFLSYPVMAESAVLFTPYFRFKFVVVSVALCQCLAVLCLYRLFLSRSLYWELSALSSYLPLRIDKSLSMKAYS